MSFLDAIVQATERRVAERRSRVSLAELEGRLRDAPPPRSLAAALRRGFGVIAEHKRRSPSGGPSEPAHLAGCLSAYAEAPWVVGVSVLTDEDYFEGRVEDLAMARERVGKPILRKDFVVDEYQVIEARAEGADAILLMASVHHRAPERLASLHRLARAVGLEVLVEIGLADRPIEELAALVPADAELWGVNARSFRKSSGADHSPGGHHALSTDVERHRRYRALVPPGRLAVAESGIHTGAELAAARAAGYHAALIGTAFLHGPRTLAEVLADLGGAFRANSA